MTHDTDVHFTKFATCYAKISAEVVRLKPSRKPNITGDSPVPNISSSLDLKRNQPTYLSIFGPVHALPLLISTSYLPYKEPILQALQPSKVTQPHKPNSRKTPNLFKIDCQDQGIDFIPICIETCGNWGKRLPANTSNLLHSRAAIAMLSFAVPRLLYPPSKQPDSCSNDSNKTLKQKIQSMIRMG